MNIKSTDNNIDNNAHESWEKRILEKLLLQTYKDQKSARTWRRLRNIFILIVLIMVLSTYFLGNFKKKTFITGYYTAIINLDSIINKSYKTDDVILNSLESAYKDKNVKGIIIKANSPGGSPVISDNIYNEIINMKKKHPNKPLFVVIEDVCASGCYYIASAADKIYANPSSLVGSIGVISYAFGFQKVLDKLEIERRIKTSGKNKAMGDMFTPENEEQKAIWQNLLNQVHQQFISKVKQGRGSRLKWQNDADIFSGRIYTGLESKKNGLIDDFGNIYTVSRDIIKAPRLIDFTIEDNVLDFITKKVGANIKNKVFDFDMH